MRPGSLPGGFECADDPYGGRYRRHRGAAVPAPCGQRAPLMTTPVGGVVLMVSRSFCPSNEPVSRLSARCQLPGWESGGKGDGASCALREQAVVARSGSGPATFGLHKPTSAAAAAACLRLDGGSHAPDAAWTRIIRAHPARASSPAQNDRMPDGARTMPLPPVGSMAPFDKARARRDVRRGRGLAQSEGCAPRTAWDRAPSSGPFALATSGRALPPLGVRTKAAPCGLLATARQRGVDGYHFTGLSHGARRHDIDATRAGKVQRVVSGRNIEVWRTIRCRRRTCAFPAAPRSTPMHGRAAGRPA